MITIVQHHYKEVVVRNEVVLPQSNKKVFMY